MRGQRPIAFAIGLSIGAAAMLATPAFGQTVSADVLLEIAQAPPPAREGSAIAGLRARADKGDAAAQNDLGVMYYKGLGVPQNYGEAARFYRLAADQGLVKAQSNLGTLYYFGRGVPKDDNEAVRLFKLAAAQGNDVAEFMLGSCYAVGRGVPKDDGEAFRYMKLAADQGHAGARNDLGLMYETGKGTPKDEAQALRLYRAAADQGNAAANQNLMRLSGKSAAKGPSGGPPGAIIEIPLRRVAGVLTVPVVVNDTVTVNFVVDSGAADVSVPESVAATLLKAHQLGAADFIGSQNYRLADGTTVASRTIVLRSLKIGDRVVANVKGSIAHGKAPPLLGQSFLGRFKTWSIDNGRQVLVLQEMPR